MHVCTSIDAFLDFILHFSISPIIPQELLGVISERIYNKLPARLLGEGQLGKSDVPTLSLNSPTRHRQRQAMGVQLISLEPDVDLADATGPGGSKYMERLGIRPGAGPSAQTAQPTPLPASPMIGNLLLSSCPGKKVRLTGPVRGRGAICRDLGLDLRRICQIGVGAVVCCLDDEELRFLGAPWEEYEREADELGLDVIRYVSMIGKRRSDRVLSYSDLRRLQILPL